MTDLKERLEGSPLMLLGHALVTACAAHDVRPGDTVVLQMVPLVWEAYEQARALLAPPPTETPT